MCAKLRVRDMCNCALAAEVGQQLRQLAQAYLEQWQSMC